MQTASLLLCLAAQLSLCAASVVVFGRGDCPNPGTQSRFIAQFYLGTWYEYQRFGNWFQVFTECGRATYGRNRDGSISVFNAGTQRIKLFGVTLREKDVSILGKATTPDPRKPAELSVSFGNGPGGSRPNYYVVETDYRSYTVVFSCTKIPLVPINIQLAWILVRSPGFIPRDIDNIKARMSAAGIDVTKLQTIDQTNCGY